MHIKCDAAFFFKMKTNNTKHLKASVAMKRTIFTESIYLIHCQLTESITEKKVKAKKITTVVAQSAVLERNIVCHPTR